MQEPSNPAPLASLPPASPVSAQPVVPSSSSNVPTDAVNEELCDLLKGIESKVSEIQALQTSRRRRAICFSILIFGAAVWFLFQISIPFREIYQNPGVFVEAIEREGAVTFFPILRYEFQKAGPAVYHAFDQAFQKEWKKRLPRFEGLMREFDLLLGQVRNTLSQQALIRVDILLERYQRRLEKDFPELAQDPEALESIHLALQSALTTVIGTRFHRPFERFGEMRDLFLSVKPPERYQQMSKGELEEELLNLITVYLNLHFRPILDNARLAWDILLDQETRLFSLIHQVDETLPFLATSTEKMGGQK